MIERFEAGKAYMATSTMRNRRRIVVVCNGREGGDVMFSVVKDLYRVPVKGIDGREVAMIQASDGFDYCTSSTVEVDVENATSVIEAIRGA